MKVDRIGTVHLLDVACVSARSKVKRARTTVRGKLLASSSVLSICFGSRVAVQHSFAPFSLTSSALLTAEALQRHHVGTNYVIKLKQPAVH